MVERRTTPKQTNRPFEGSGRRFHTMTNETLPPIRRGDMLDRRNILRIAIASTGILGMSVMIRRRGTATGDHKPASLPDTTLEMPKGDVERLNVALNLAYLHAQYHRRATGGDGLPSYLLKGIGRQGAVHGGRKVAFGDSDLARYAEELAIDMIGQVAALRGALEIAAAAQPVIDISGGLRGPFAVAGRAALPHAMTFDPFSGDTAFLLGAFLIGNEVAACLRMLLADIMGSRARATITAVLADAIYHGGLIRSLLATKSMADPTIARALASLCAMQTSVVYTAGSYAVLSTRRGYGADLIDAAGNPLPFWRSPAQVMAMRCLPGGGCLTGGFFPAGFNGLAL
ncbi:MAG: hypothetical protein EOP66_00010 [Sphingomonas sp.]|nr:MAG: hypothetical protein EOP66_00010 [Sphingomonas sp.]